VTVASKERRPGEWSLRRRVKTAHGEVAYDVLGHGPPVVLVHGTPGRSVLWRAVAPALADRFTVHVYDLLGFGESERRVEQDTSIARQGELLAELVGKWGLEQPALVGHDIGGATVLRAHLLGAVAARCLALLDAVVLRPWITPTTRHLQAHLDVYRTMPQHLFREVTATHLRTATHRPMDAETFAAYFDQWEGERGQALWLRNVAGFDEQHTRAFEHELGSLQTPTLVIWGEHDAWLDVSLSARITALLPNAERVVIPGAGHFSPEDQPDAVASTLLEYLARF